MLDSLRFNKVWVALRARLAGVLAKWSERLRPSGTEIVLADLSPGLRRMRSRSFCAECSDPFHREDGQCMRCRNWDREHRFGDFDPRFAGRRYWPKPEKRV